MDYVKPVEAVIPGVQGKVLGALSRTGTALTMRTVARLAGVSANRATAVLNNLIALGLVERREAGSAALVALAPENEAARAIARLAALRDTVMSRLQEEARAIQPAPASLVIFGSFAAGMAGDGSDVDALAVRAQGVKADDPRWLASLGHWADRAGRIAGNPVNLMEVPVDDVPELIRQRESVWEDAARHGVLLVGSAFGDAEVWER